jgi:hypothetical protein
MKKCELKPELDALTSAQRRARTRGRPTATVGRHDAHVAQARKERLADSGGELGREGVTKGHSVTFSHYCPNIRLCGDANVLNGNENQRFLGGLDFT